MLTYLLLIITLYLAGNTYIFIRATQALKVKPLGVKILLTVLFWTCALSFFGTMLARNLEMPVFISHSMYTIGTSWLIFTLYMALFLLLFDILKLFKVVYKYRFYLSLVFTLGLLGCGVYNYHHPETNVVSILTNKRYEDRVYLGATLGVYDVNYDRYTSYTENLNDDKGADNGGYTLDNYYRLEGTGMDLKLGVIVRPIESSPFRLGFAVHTPTWYDLRESYNATLSSDILAYEKPYIQTLSDFLVTPEYDYLTYDYNLTTPWKFNVSAGTTFAGAVAVGAEYEYQDYSSSKLKDVDGYELGDQPSVENYLKGVHTFRIGMETRIIPEFSIRAGYNYSSAAFSKDAYSALSLYSTRTDFNNTESKNTFTFGLGYRGSVIYADLAYKYDMYKSNFYAFDDIDLPATKVDNERHQLLLTVGARF